MDTRIKTGDNLVCDYTGVKTSSVIKIYSADDDTETGWLCFEALDQAHKLLSSFRKQEVRPDQVPMRSSFDEVEPLAPNPPAPAPAPSQLEELKKKEPATQPIRSVAANAPRTLGINPKVPKTVLKNFEKAIVDLKENPPKTRDSDPDGVIPESSIKDLIKNFLPYFGQNKNQMFTPLRKAFNLDMGRFKILVEGIK